MILRPASVASQTAGLQALSQLVVQYPVCEKWILLLQTVNEYWGQLTPDALRYVAQISDAIGKVLRWIQGQSPPYVPAQQYITTLATGAQDVKVAAYLAAINASGALKVELTSAAVGALSTLQAWDDALNLYVPANPPQTGYLLVTGVNVGVS